MGQMIPVKRPAAFWDAAGTGVEKALEAVRSHLGMDVAFVSEFVGDRRYFRHVDAPAGQAPIRVGNSLHLDEGYCRHIIEGRLPQLIPDTGALPEARAIAATAALPIGSHLSVPLRFADGSLYGTFCCFSFEPDRSLNERDLQVMHAFAQIVGHQLEETLREARRHEEARRRVAAVLRSRDPDIVYQPIHLLLNGQIVGAEALARFKAKPVRSPDKWFQEAAEAGLQVRLERKALRNALLGFRGIWERSPLYLGLNASARTIISGNLAGLIEDYPAERIVLEVTEHEHIADYGALREALAPLRARGVQLAVDDAGSGYASMQHILHLAPDIIKLDISLTRDIDSDPMRRALAKALIGFGRETGSRIVAEGIETPAELQTLRRLGVHAAQGYHLGRPMPADDLRERLDAAADR